ncbi:lipopolysaccharide assembly protein LapB [uncultured Shewanella sp.]|uniref:tetratricopeptide repeat protein n=1 Tax=uncultured Shewanella sp. TaxID=173975 RepID=UPI00261B5995|nr:tetratricopeptide repeat protein [uncultured Shewanella sp.]
MFAFIEKLSHTQRKYALILGSISLFLGALLLWSLSGSQQAKLANGAIIVLPIKQQTESNSTNWQAYARMEKVINQLGTSANYPVLLTEDVIAMLSQASSFIDDGQAIDLNRLFNVSGAALVVESSISTTPQLQLSYRLLNTEKIKQGVIKAESIDALQQALVDTIEQFVDSHYTQTASREWFSEPQLIAALRQIQYRELAQAESSLKQLLDSDPTNLTAIRLLAQLHIDAEELNSAEQLLIPAIKQAEQNNKRQLARLRLTLAQVKLDNEQLELAISELSQARALAANTQDWLYLGYISNWSGHIYQRLNRYNKARAQYQYAFEYQNKSGYPSGQVAALNNLARLEIIEHNYSAAYKAVKQSVAIVTQRKLTHLHEETFTLLTKIENKLQRIR